MAANFDIKTGLFWLVILALCFVAIPVHRQSQDDTKSMFDDYLLLHQKKYDGQEYNRRLENFKATLDRIEKRNGKVPRSARQGAKYGLNQFSDLSPDEFRKRYLVRPNNLKAAPRPVFNESAFPILKLGAAGQYPDKLDWRDKKVITGVKDQGQCGACWAFSVVECMESMNAIKHGTLENLSVQQVIDCAGNGNMGCNGGNTCTAVEWMVGQKVPIAVESSYPLTLVDGTCPASKPATGIQVESNYTCNSFINMEDKIIAMLNTLGPLSVAVDGTSWQDYLGGVIQYNCEANLNHAAQIVGYDRTTSPGYYIVRNSWGKSFGISGYLHVAIGSNLCGIAMEVVGLSVK